MSLDLFGVQPVQYLGIISFVEDDFRSIPCEEMKADFVLVANGKEAPATDSAAWTCQVRFNAVDRIQRNANECALGVPPAAEKQPGALTAKAV
jgi:hypothetical protein